MYVEEVVGATQYPKDPEGLKSAKRHYERIKNGWLFEDPDCYWVTARPEVAIQLRLDKFGGDKRKTRNYISQKRSCDETDRITVRQSTINKMQARNRALEARNKELELKNKLLEQEVTEFKGQIIVLQSTLEQKKVEISGYKAKAAWGSILKKSGSTQVKTSQ